MADILFLPEAKEKSGSLITAEFAYQFQKPVYSVPASIFSPQSAGIFQKLHAQKIQLITDFDTCFSQHFPCLDPITQKSKQQQILDNISPLQQNILELLSRGEMSLDQLHHETRIQPPILMQELTYLEMENLVSQLQPNIYVLS